MLWMDIDITAFPTPTLWEWVDRVKGWERVLRAEIDRRTVEATEGPTVSLSPPLRGERDRPSGEGEGGATNPPTDRDGRPTLKETIQAVEDGVFEFKKKMDADRGAPPPTDGGGG